MAELCELSAVELRRLIGSKNLSPVELLRSCQARTERYDRVINAIPFRDWGRAELAAREAENAVMRGDRLGCLHGLPVPVKDLSHVAGMPTTFGSRIYRDFVPATDDRMVELVREAGGIIFGKTNTTEFGAGNNTTNDVFGPTRNPYALELTSGGSSGGAAAALAVDMCPIATGSDTGGSLRVPSAFCATVALRPSQGVVPFERRAFAHSPFQLLGPMARNVRDCELLFRAMAREDDIDPLSRRLDRTQGVDDVDPASLRVAFSADLGFVPTGTIVRTAFSEKISQFERLFKTCESRHPEISGAVEANWVLRIFQFYWTQRKHYAEHPDLLGPLVLQNFKAGRELTVERVAWAKAEQMSLHHKAVAFFKKFDLLIVPTASVPPWPVEHLYPHDVDGQAQETHVRWAGLTNALSVLNCPVVALPCGLHSKGLPFGLQLVGPPGSDYWLLSVARALEWAFERNELLRRPRPDFAYLDAAVEKTEAG